MRRSICLPSSVVDLLALLAIVPKRQFKLSRIAAPRMLLAPAQEPLRLIAENPFSQVAGTSTACLQCRGSRRACGQCRCSRARRGDCSGDRTRRGSGANASLCNADRRPLIMRASAVNVVSMLRQDYTPSDCFVGNPVRRVLINLQAPLAG